VQDYISSITGAAHIMQKRRNFNGSDRCTLEFASRKFAPRISDSDQQLDRSGNYRTREAWYDAMFE
jgi:hypothetical protein